MLSFLRGFTVLIVPTKYYSTKACSSCSHWQPEECSEVLMITLMSLCIHTTSESQWSAVKQTLITVKYLTTERTDNPEILD